GLPAWLNMRVGMLQVNGLHYRKPGKTSIDLTAVSTMVTWQGSLLTLRDIAVTAPEIRVDGTLMAGFSRPSLLLNLTCTPGHPAAGIDKFLLSAAFSPARSPEQVAGTVKLTAISGRLERMRLNGELGLAGNSLEIKSLNLQQPGRRGSINGSGSISFAGAKAFLKVNLGFAGLDLSPEIGSATDLSGHLLLSGGPDAYRGDFTLANKGPGWRAGRLSGSLRGDGKGVRLTLLSGLLLEGVATGEAKVEWQDGVVLRGTLRARNLNPAKVSKQLIGAVNMDLDGSIHWFQSAPLQGELKGRLLGSRLLGRALTGEVNARLLQDNIMLNRLDLHGKGFDVHASGQLRERLAFAARVGELSLLMPSASGEMRGEGWLRWHKKRFSGAVTGVGRSIRMDGVSIGTADLSFTLSEGAGYPLQFSSAIRGLVYHKLHADAATLTVTGALERHTISAALLSTGFEARTTLAGAYKKGIWQGELTGLSGYDAAGPWQLHSPAVLIVSADAVSLASIFIKGGQGEFLSAGGELKLNPLRGSVRTEWSGLNLARFTLLPADSRLAGNSSGSLQSRWPGDGKIFLSGRVDASGALLLGRRRMAFRQASLQMAWDGNGIRNLLDLNMVDGGRVRGSFSSPLPATAVFPPPGAVEVEWDGLEMELLRPWLPGNLDLAGRLEGKLKGSVLSGNRLDLKGSSLLSEGSVRWTGNGGQLSSKLSSADISFSWQGEKLNGAFAVALAEYGEASGSFQLPLPAHLSSSIIPNGPVNFSLTGRARELGLLASIFPGLVQESQGKLDFAVRAGGKWRNPEFSGKVLLSQAAAYLPTAGIHLKNVELSAYLLQDQLIVDAFRTDSGPGRIGGNGVVQFKAWQVTGYKGRIHGERFQAVYLPELQLLVTPRLNFSGDMKKLSVEGEIVVPELTVNDKFSRAPIQPSADVVLEGEPGQTKKEVTLPLDIKVDLILGDKVQVKSQGIDAQLKGSLKLLIRNLDEIRSTGEIRVVNGKYKTYGASLDITRGRIYYAGGSIDQPTLDIQAVRKIGDVRAGVTIAGTPSLMTVKLFSEPNMPDGTILSYIILGQPLAYTQEQRGLITRGAGSLLSTSSGYRPIQGSVPAGISQGKGAGSTLSQSIVSIGRYLTPALYISYGRSLLTNINLLRVRYSLSRHWEVETQAGTESGGDISFKIDFR
ncbi:MAG: translocation/assembly module TamB domain-containing protein, partial [Deltaproteobacteria bacterium]